MIQVFAKTPCLDLAFEITVTRSDQPRFELLRLDAPQPLEAVLLQHAQQFALQVERQLGDFVQEQRALARRFEPADASALGVGISPCLGAEQFGLDKRVRNRRAVDGHERLGGSLTVVVNGVRNEFLAHTALAHDQRRQVVAGEQHDLFEQRLHRRALADQCRMVGFGRADRGSRRFRFRPVQSPAQQLAQLGQLDRLAQVVEGAEVHRAARRLQRTVGGHDDDGHLRRDRADLVERVDAVAPGHADVQERHRGFLLTDERYGLGPVRRQQGLVAFFGQKRREGFADSAFVVGYEDFGHGDQLNWMLQRL